MLAQVVPSCHTMLQVPVWIGSGSGTSAIDPTGWKLLIQAGVGQHRLLLSCQALLQVPVWIRSGSGTSAIDPTG